jgi:hypothetical protein
MTLYENFNLEKKKSPEENSGRRQNATLLSLSVKNMQTRESKYVPNNFSVILCVLVAGIPLFTRMLVNFPN